MKWFKEHKFLTSSLLAVAICLGFLGVILTDMFKDTPSSSHSEISSTESTQESNPSQTLIEYNENPFNQKNPQFSENDIQTYIHGMSHQKVKSDDKWIHYELTSERIVFLLKVVTEQKYKHGEVYKEILSRWSKGDFSRADKDHNEIWRLQGGTIGKASGVMSAEEEESYIEENEKKIK